MRDDASMGYRDELGAAHARAATLEAELDRLAASSAADADRLAHLRRELASAREEIAALAVYAPDSAARRSSPYRLVIAGGLALLVATGVAGFVSERFGVLMSYLAAATLSAGIGGWMAARRSRVAGVLGAALGALLALAAAAIFYEAVWPSL